MSTGSVIIDALICLGLTLVGGAMGMDRSHTRWDYVGPFIIFCGCFYALYCGFYIIAGFIAFLGLMKLLTR